MTVPLCGEVTGDRWILLTKASDAELLIIFLICAGAKGLVNNRDAGDLRRHRAHYNVTVLTIVVCMFCRYDFICLIDLWDQFNRLHSDCFSPTGCNPRDFVCNGEIIRKEIRTVARHQTTTKAKRVNIYWELSLLTFVKNSWNNIIDCRLHLMQSGNQAV